jgi:hypothetical protein
MSSAVKPRLSTADRVFQYMLACVVIAPFGNPVLPDVKFK